MISFVQSVSTLQGLISRQRTTNETTRLMIQAEHEVATGRHADAFKALGTRSTEALNTRAMYDRTEGRIESNTLLQNRLDLMASSLGNVREAAQEVMTMAITNTDPTSSDPQFLQQMAIDAFNTIASFMNASYNGKAFFAGVDSDANAVNNWGQADTTTGLRPSDVMSAIVGGGIASAADAAAKIAEIDAVFHGTPANPNHAYEQTFFNGTALMNGAVPNPRLTAQIDEDFQISYGVQANDDGIRELMQGLSMLASTDPVLITDPAAYSAWIGAAASKLATGVDAVLAAEARTGSMQKLVEDANSRLSAKKEVLSLHISSLETVDPYEAATRLTSAETQLKASYAVTARLQAMSFLNFMT
ncbi:flagellin [Pseudooceanicola sp.]|uniref:flagellin n=1 Tax=Pseudooceanicola sp. TaxID=1914328 RepID=UPI0035C751E0